MIYTFISYFTIVMSQVAEILPREIQWPLYPIQPIPWLLISRWHRCQSHTPCIRRSIVPLINTKVMINLQNRNQSFYQSHAIQIVNPFRPGDRYITEHSNAWFIKWLIAFYRHYALILINAYLLSTETDRSETSLAVIGLMVGSMADLLWSPTGSSFFVTQQDVISHAHIHFHQCQWNNFLKVMDKFDR